MDADEKPPGMDLRRVSEGYAPFLTGLEVSINRVQSLELYSHKNYNKALLSALGRGK